MSKYFKSAELACKCCGASLMKEGTLAKLDFARELANVPFVITSGYRCNAHNQAVGGVKDSSHTRGRAVDIKINTEAQREFFIACLKKAEFNRFGIGKTFLHVDDDPDKPKNSVWKY